MIRTAWLIAVENMVQMSKGKQCKSNREPQTSWRLGPSKETDLSTRAKSLKIDAYVCHLYNGRMLVHQLSFPCYVILWWFSLWSIQFISDQVSQGSPATTFHKPMCKLNRNCSYLNRIYAHIKYNWPWLQPITSNYVGHSYGRYHNVRFTGDFFGVPREGMDGANCGMMPLLNTKITTLK